MGSVEEQWLLEWFAKRGVAVPEIDDCVSLDFIEQGWLDSFAMVELIVEIEAEFSVQLEHEDFIDGTFFTITGLGDMVAARR